MFRSLQAINYVKHFVKTTACIFLLVACEKVDNFESIEQSRILKRSIYSEQFQLDPHYLRIAADSAPLRDLLIGLTAYNSKGNIIPAISKNWFSEDQKEWLFILDEDAKWSNGDPVIAQDFVASWQRLIAPENQALLAKYLVYMGVENSKAIQEQQKSVTELGVLALNDHTLKILLNRPNPMLPNMLAHAALLPTYRGIKPSNNNFLSNGAYQVKQLTSTKIELTARDENTPFQTVEYEILSQVKDELSSDILENPSLNQERNILTFPRLCTYYYEFNFQDPVLSKKTIREAIRAMLTSSNIGQVYGIPSQWAIPDNLVTREKKWNPVVVEQLLTQEGINQSSPLKLVLLYDESNINIEIAHKMIRALSQSELFSVSAKMLDWLELNQLRARKEYQLIRSGWCADYRDPLVFLLKFHSRSPDNFSGYKNRLVDKNIERLQSEALNVEERALLIQEVNEQLYNDAAVLPLFQYQYRISASPSLLGIDLNNDSGVIYSKDLQRISE